MALVQDKSIYRASTDRDHLARHGIELGRAVFVLVFCFRARVLLKPFRRASAVHVGVLQMYPLSFPSAPGAVPLFTLCSLSRRRHRTLTMTVISRPSGAHPTEGRKERTRAVALVPKCRLSDGVLTAGEIMGDTVRTRIPDEGTRNPGACELRTVIDFAKFLQCPRHAINVRYGPGRHF